MTWKRKQVATTEEPTLQHGVEPMSPVALLMLSCLVMFAASGILLTILDLMEVRVWLFLTILPLLIAAHYGGAKDAAERTEKLAELEVRRRRLADLYVAGVIDQDGMTSQAEQIRQEQAKLEPHAARRIMHAGEMMLDLPELWRVASAIERRQLLQPLLQAVHVDQGRVLALRPTKASEPLLTTMSLTNMDSTVVILPPE